MCREAQGPRDLGLRHQSVAGIATLLARLEQDGKADGSIDAKLGWWRGVGRQLTIRGRRLDAKAPPLRARIPQGYGWSGFQATGVIFPTEGYWQVTGRVGQATLRFVTLVVKRLPS